MNEKTEQIRDTTKDFLTHLRLVHFGLAVTSLVLLVTSTITPPYVLENAYRQAGELRWIESNDVMSLLNITPLSQVQSLFLASPFSFTDGNTRLSPAFDDSIVFVDIKSLVAIVRYTEFVLSEKLFEEDVTFETLNGFRNFWDYLRRMRDTPAIVSWSPENIDFMLTGSTEWQAGNGNFTFVSGSSYSSGSHMDIRRIEFVKSKDGKISLVCRFKPMSHGVPVNLKSIRIPVTLEKRNYQALLSTKLGVEWRPGEFTYSFKDLDRFTKNLGSLNFQELEDHLSSLASEVDTPIQLFGAAIPVSSLRIWGPVILLVIQAYFLLHFRRFKRTIRDSGESQFAWLGVYDDRMSKVLFGFSISILPMSSVMAVGVLSENITLLPLDPIVILMLIVTAISIVLGFATLLEVSKTARKMYTQLLCRQLTKR